MPRLGPKRRGGATYSGAGMDLRCPTCDRLVVAQSDDFVGTVVGFCRHCKQAFPDSSEDLPKLRCRCGKWILAGSIQTGWLRTVCWRCRAIANFGPGSQRAMKTEPPKPRTDEDFLQLIEDRWTLVRADRAWQRADVAVGLRFQVFARDGFRCVYCGRTPGSGVILEADHVQPRSKGGLDTLDNLVTACMDCNRGKSDRLLDTGAYSQP